MKMSTLCNFLFPTFLLTIAFPAFADVAVSSPGNGDEVTAPFELTASSPTCSSQTVTAMGYSLDNSPNTATVSGTWIQANVSAGTGAHTLHVKSWGNKGSACVTDVDITVTAGSGSAVSADGITVQSPGSGATVGSPFGLTASAPSCSGQTVSAMGYSLDESAATTIVNGTSINATVSSGTGSHTIHVKSWGNQGSACTAVVNIKVGSASSSVATTVNGIEVSSPGNNAQVSSPFDVVASAPTCSSQAVGSMGFSFDSSPDTTIVSGTSINKQVSAGSGAHTLHIKSWGKGGGSCVANIPISVSAPANTSVIPSNAVKVSSIQTLKNWETEYDVGTKTGYSTGSMSLVGSPTHEGGSARQFVTNFSNYAGERFDVSFGDDTTSQNFFYDVWVYLTGSTSQMANLELDMNQTMPNGQTAIFGFQCDGYSSTWDYTANKGTPSNPVDTWVHSSQPCNIHNWGVNAWHHVQVSYSRNNSGAVTYKSVWLDDKEQDIYATVSSAFALGWGPSLLTNLQVDGQGSGGTITMYLDDLTVYRW